MGVRKKHHYVPRFYLKRFSINNDGKLIGLYNYTTKTYVSAAQLKHQACEEYLYGRDDKIEAELARLENSIASLFYYWTEEKILVPPPEGTNGLIVLKRFILYQLYRTPKAGARINESINDAFHACVQIYLPDKLKEFEGNKMAHRDPTLLALVNSAEQEHLLNFLSCKFIVNLSYLPFISSDAPVIMYNQFMENAGLYIGATTPVVKGLQIFYPIHPRLMICLYDPQVYSCSGKNCLSTESIEDVHQLNALQYLNSHSQLFFNEVINQEYIENIVKGYSEKKNKPRCVSQLTQTGDGTYFYFHSFEDAHIDLKLSFFETLPFEENANLEIAPLRHSSFERD